MVDLSNLLENSQNILVINHTNICLFQLIIVVLPWKTYQSFCYFENRERSPIYRLEVIPAQSTTVFQSKIQVFFNPLMASLAASDLLNLTKPKTPPFWCTKVMYNAVYNRFWCWSIPLLKFTHLHHHIRVFDLPKMLFIS